MDLNAMAYEWGKRSENMYKHVARHYGGGGKVVLDAFSHNFRFPINTYTVDGVPLMDILKREQMLENIKEFV